MDYGVTGANGAILPGRQGGFGWNRGWLGPHLNGLLSWWPLDGNASDAGPFDADGIMLDGLWVTERPPNLVWSIQSFHTKGYLKGRVDFSAHADKFDTLMRGSISLWMKTDKAAPIMVLFGCANRSSFKSMQLFVRNGIVHYDVYGDLPAENIIVGRTFVADGFWHHIVLTCDSNALTSLYVDGFLESSGIEGFFSHVFRMNGMWIGRLHFVNSTRHFDGEIDDLAIWGDVLTPTQVQTLASLPPALIPTAAAQNGPALAVESLATGARPNGAFGTFGFAPVGNRISNDTNNTAVRVLTNSVNLAADNTRYISCLLRLENPIPNASFEIQLSDRTDVHCRFGWNDADRWIAGFQFTSVGESVLPGTTYFAVCKIASSNASPDTISLKVYKPGEVVSATEPTAWTVVHGSESLGNKLNALWLRRTVGGSLVEVDELRLGKTWESVTRVGYGSGCLGASIGRSNSPVVGSNNFAVHLTGASNNQSAFLSFGGSRTTWSSLPLPFDLAAIGAPGCSVLASFDAALLTATGGSGAATITLPVPAEPALVGETVYLQWASIDALRTNRLALAFSDAMEVTFEF